MYSISDTHRLILFDSFGNCPRFGLTSLDSILSETWRWFHLPPNLFPHTDQSQYRIANHLFSYKYPVSNFGICLYCCLMILILCIPDFRKIDWITLDCFFVFVVRSTYDFSFYSFMTVTTSSIYKMEPT